MSIECLGAWVARALAGRSALFRAMGDEGPRAWPWVALVAAGVRPRPDCEADEAFVDWLRAEWPKRARGAESAEAFGARAAEKMRGLEAPTPPAGR